MSNEYYRVSHVKPVDLLVLLDFTDTDPTRYCQSKLVNYYVGRVV